MRLQTQNSDSIDWRNYSNDLTKMQAHGYVIGKGKIQAIWAIRAELISQDGLKTNAQNRIYENVIRSPHTLGTYQHRKY